MINAEKFQNTFNLYATELWATPEKEFLEWLNAEYKSDQLCDDAISREAVLNLAYWHGKPCTYDNIDPEGCDAVDTDEIEKLPSVQPMRLKGEWIPLDLSMINTPYYCSCCFKHAPIVATRGIASIQTEVMLSDFCPNCGAKMEGTE